MNPFAAVARTGANESAPLDMAGPAGAAKLIAQTIVFALGFTYVLAAASLSVFGALSWAFYPAAAVLAAAVSLMPGGSRRTVERAWRSGGIALGVLFLVAVPPLASRWFDGSHDGLAYHQSAILQLASGWNPLRGEAPHVAHMKLELTHYPRASWILGAVLMKCFGTIEAVKAVNLLSMIAAGAMAMSVLLKQRSSASGAVLAAVIGAGIAANPVGLAQLFSSYVDGFLASLLLLAILASIRVALGGGYRAALVLALSIVLCVNVKFTAVVYVGVGLLVIAGLYLFTRRDVAVLRVMACWVGALVAGVCVLGADPYLTNTVRYGHPFYPALGENEDMPRIMLENRPREFRDMSGAERFARSLFSAPKNAVAGPSVLRPPWIVTRDDIFQLAHYDLRIGGFGPLFGAAFVMSLPLLFFVRGSPAFWAALVFVGTSVAINPESWWARYVPQLWWFPWIAVAGVAVGGARGIPRGIALFVGVVLAANAAIVGGASIGHAYFYSAKQRSLIASLAERQAKGENTYTIYFGPLEGTAHRYTAAGIRFDRVESAAQLPCANPENLGGPGPVVLLCGGTSKHRKNAGE